MNTQTIGITWTTLSAIHCGYLDAIDQTPKHRDIKNVTLYLGVDNEYKKLTLALHQGKALTQDELDRFKLRVAEAIKFLKAL